MNNKILIAVAVALVLILGGGAAYMMMKNNKTNSSGEAMTPTPTGMPAPTKTAAQSLRDLLTSGLTQKCSFGTGEASGSASGTIYISSGKVRGDVTTAGGTMHMIVDGSTSYIWNGDSKSGFKVSWTPTSAGTPSTPNGSSFDANKQMNYDCTVWTADPSLFTVPAGVTFSDMSKIAVPSITTKMVVPPDIKY